MIQNGSLDNISNNLTAFVPPVELFFKIACCYLLILAGYGNFTFKMDFYKDSSFATSYTEKDYPLDTSLNDYVYLGFRVESGADLVIMAENCKATKDGNFYSWPQYTIIENG